MHTDIANAFRNMPPPNLPWILNTIWMLTDFTATNGATRVVPFSHGSQRATPIPGSEARAIPVVGEAGSVLVFHPAIFHAAGPNSADDVRVGLNIGYHGKTRAVACATQASRLSTVDCFALPAHDSYPPLALRAAAWWNPRVRAGADDVYPPIPSTVYAKMPGEMKALLYAGRPRI